MECQYSKHITHKGDTMTPKQLRDAIRAGIRTVAQAARWKQNEARRQRAAVKASFRGMI